MSSRRLWLHSHCSRSVPPSRDVSRLTNSSSSVCVVSPAAAVLIVVIVLLCSLSVICDLIPSAPFQTSSRWPSINGAQPLPPLPLNKSTRFIRSQSQLRGNNHAADPTYDLVHSGSASAPVLTNQTEKATGGGGGGGGSVKPIIIGYLTNFYGRQSPTRQGLVISGAISYAIHHINNDTPQLLNGRPLKLIYNDTSATSVNGTAALISQWRSGAVAFFGPEDTCEVEATIAAALNLPMISYKCANSAVSNKAYFPTFARTHPPDVIVVRSVLALLSYYQWRKFGIVWYKHSPKFAPVVATLREVAAAQKFMVMADYSFDDDFQCCINKERCCGNVWSDLVDKTYRQTRIYVFFGGGSLLSHFLLALKSRGLLDHGEYVVISVELEEDYLENQAYRFINQRTDLPQHELNAINEASRSLLVIARSPPESPYYSQFVEKVREYNKLAPFSLSDRMDFKRHVTYYAAYLYDAVILYAEALAQAFKDGLTEYDGREIIKRIIERRRYKSVTGAWMYIDQNGDVQGNYTVLQASFKKKHYRSAPDSESIDPLWDDSKVSGFYMSQVGTFQFDELHNRTTFSPTGVVDWVRPGHVPLDEPPCGFDDRACDKSEAKVREILTGILVSAFLVTSVLISIAYRSWKFEQEIDGLLWKLNTEDICFDDDKAKILSSSRASLISASSLTQAKINDLSETKLATYKGAVVSLKEFHFRSKKNSTNNAFDYLTRDDKKEMKYMKEMHHKNINPFIGACTHPQQLQSVFIVTDYCAKGSLKEIIENEEIKLEEDFLSSLIYGIMSGISYLHKSEIKYHGNLKSSNCLVTSRWVLKLTDFGLHRVRAAAETDLSENPVDHSHYDLLWTAPELLRVHNELSTPEADIYAFGIILHEMILRKGPFGIKEFADNSENEFARKIIEHVKMEPSDGNEYRPNTTDIEVHNDVIEIMKSCWREDPRARPNIDLVRGKFKTCQKFKPPAGNLVDSMMKLMEVYQTQLEDLVDKRTVQLNEEKKKTETLLHRMLPESVAKQLIQGANVVPEAFDAVTIFFSDIVGFTSLSAESTPMQVVTFLNDLYTLFDSIISNYDVYKVETIGDAYMVVSGLPIRNGDKHCTEIASMALEMLESIKSFQIRHRPNEVLQLRIGIHSGSVVAGVVGLKMPRYCLFGDTVNTASRMESNGEALKIHISPECRDCLEPTKQYIIEERGLVAMKGKGDIRTYWLTGHTEGPKPRLKQTFDSLKVDSPWLSKDSKPKPHITFFDDEVVSSARKGSLVPFPANPSNLYKKTLTGRSALANSIMRLKSSYSNSCSTVGLSNTETPSEAHTSPKLNKRNWNFRLFNGKIRSMSTNHPGDVPPNHISMKETKTPRCIIKSPSYNTIESLNQRSIDTDLGSFDAINNPANSLARSQFEGSFIEESSLTEVPDEERSNQFASYKSDESADEYGEDRPLLATEMYRPHNNTNLARQISLAEEDEDFVEATANQVNASVHSEPDQFDRLLVVNQNGNSHSFPHSNCDISSSDKHFTSSPTSDGPNCSLDSSESRAYYVALQDAISLESEQSELATSPNGHHSPLSHSPLNHKSKGNEFVCLDLSPSRTDSFYYENHLVATSSANTTNGTSVKIKGTV